MAQTEGGGGITHSNVCSKLQWDRKPEIHFHRLSAVCSVSARGHISLLSLSFVQTM